MAHKPQGPDERGYFGDFGGRFVPEVLVDALKVLEREVSEAFSSEEFWQEYYHILRDFVGRPTPIFKAARAIAGVQEAPPWFILKREDLNHTGSHKINNTVGQGLLARRMGKGRLIAETGAGQHGVATATVGALFGIPVDVYMGAADVERQSLNVY
ncbi:MAG: pyridoxal-phosphate dependent enzyme, partial [Candidatus Eremiobacteraeota bacterium]|nr:pyridoxal-phosphate dependent enzyme [Candidatus Eremiobacteraeota bacterium]